MQSIVPTQYWHVADDGRLVCDVCPRACKLQEGQQGLCFVRARQNDRIVLTSYGRSSGFCIDPIEKKPLNHFLPGSAVLSFGTAGCNLSCKFCQNWDISKAREMDRLCNQAEPERIAEVAAGHQCRSVAFTYNDPVIFLEYANDTADACHQLGIQTVAVTAAYINSSAGQDFFSHVDAANIDLKAFTDRFYRKICGGHLQPVLDTIQYLHDETQVWMELTTLIIAGENDSEAEIRAMSDWVMDNLGPDVPMHFSAFHPDWKMRDKPATALQSLINARQYAMQSGINYVYTGNVHYQPGDTTYCPNCQSVPIERDWYNLNHWQLTPDGCCSHCGYKPAGVFDRQPGNWGAKRLPVNIQANF